MKILILLIVVFSASRILAQATPSISPISGQSDTISLREYIDVRFISLNDKIEAADKASQLAIDKAEHTINLRLESMNEFREQLKDQSATFTTKDEYSVEIKSMNDKIDEMTNRLANLDGSIRIIVAIFAIIQSAILIWIARRKLPSP